MDNLFDPEEDIAEKKLSKFKPKAREKTVRLAAKALSKASNDSTLASYRLAVQDSNNRPDMLVSEAVPRNSEKQKYAGEDANISFNLDSSNDHLGASSTTDVASASSCKYNEPSTVRGSVSRLSSPDQQEGIDNNGRLLEDGKQVSASGNEVSIMLSNMESLDDHKYHSSASAENSFKQPRSDDNPEGLFHLPSPTSDPNRDFQDTSEEPFGNVSLSTSVEEGNIFPAASKEQADLAEAAKATSRNDVADIEAHCEAGDELEQQVEERPTHETVEVIKSGKSLRILRKRVHKSSTSMEDETDNDWNVEHSEILEMDDDPSDMEYQDEEISKKKRYHKKPKKQISETEKPKRRYKKVSNESDSTKKEQPKKKFPHATQRRRRQVEKALLQTPEDEINMRQLAIKDLIMLAEAREKISSKTAAALGKSFSNGSQGTKSNNEYDGLGEEEERNHYDDEASERSQATQKKLNYQSYMNKPLGVRWSKSEIDLLYQAIRQFGTDFAMMQQLFPNRTRHQVKLKFKNEERKHPLQVQDALLHRCNDNSYFKQVIEQLKINHKDTSTQDAHGDPSMHDPNVESFKEDEGDPHKDEDTEGREYEGLMNVDKDESNNPENLNGLQGLFDWDAGDAYSEGMEEYAS